MDENILQEKIRLLQEKYTAMITQAAQEGRTDDIQSISDQMQQEIQSLIDTETQSAMNRNVVAPPAGTEEDQDSEDLIEEVEDWGEEDEDEDEEDEDWGDDEEEDEDEDWDDDEEDEDEDWGDEDDTEN